MPARRVRCLRTLVWVLAAAGLVQSQRGTAQASGGPQARLEQLASAQESALASGDPASIGETSRQLAAGAGLLLAALEQEEGEPARALETLRRAWAVHPEAPIGMALVSAELEAQHGEAAKGVAGQLIALGGDQAPLHLALASAFHAGGDLPGTIAQLERAVALGPAEGGAHLALGSAFWELNEYGYNPESLREFEAAQRLDPEGYFSNYNLGVVLSQYQRFADAAVYLARAAAAEPRSPDPWLQLGLNDYARDSPTEARAALERAISLTGAEESRNGFAIRRAYAVLSRLNWGDGRAEEARRMEARADALRRQVAREQAGTSLSESTSPMLAVAPGRVAANAAGHGVRAENAHATEAQRVVERQLKTIIARSLNDAGTVLARGRDYAGALPLFRDGAAEDPSLVPLMRNLGLAAFHTGSYAEAVSALTQAAQQDPGDSLAQSYLERARAAAAAPLSATPPP